MTEPVNTAHDAFGQASDFGAVNPAAPARSVRDAGAAAKRRRTIGVASAVVAAIIIVILLLSLTRCGAQQQIALAPEPDAAVQSMDQPEEKLEAGEGGGAVNITYSGNASIDLVTRTVSMHLENPSRSTHDMSIQLVIVSDGAQTVVAESGLVPAGYELSTMELLDNVSLIAGSYQGFYRISFFDPESSEKAYMQSEVTLDAVTAS